MTKNKTSKQIASENIQRDLIKFQREGGEIKKLAHNVFGAKMGKTRLNGRILNKVT